MVFEFENERLHNFHLSEEETPAKVKLSLLRPETDSLEYLTVGIELTLEACAVGVGLLKLCSRHGEPGLLKRVTSWP